MVALVTGASSGIGKDIARELAKRNYDIIAVARNEEGLKEVKIELEEKYHVKVDIRSMDLIDRDGCRKLYEDIQKQYGTVEILVNNAGFGTCGEFTKTDLDKELGMIDTNIAALHILTKLFLRDMVKENKGHILNVASIAGFMPGPLMATYYSTKAYIVRLTQALYTELKKKKSKVKISALCPGPVNTNFNKVANVKFNLKGQSSEFVAKYGIDEMLKGKTIILSGGKIKIARFLAKISPEKLVARICMKMQEKKR